jgi:uncharacterized protein (DUF433 family)
MIRTLEECRTLAVSTAPIGAEIWFGILPAVLPQANFRCASSAEKQMSTEPRTRLVLVLFYAIIILNMSDLLNRITINPKQCGGRPCIRGMRIRVVDVLDLFAAGLSAEKILEEMPDLEREDLQAALQYAARKLDYPILPVTA